MCCLLYDICKWLDILVFTDKDDKSWAPSPASFLGWLAGDVRKPTHFSQSVGNVAPSVVVWPCYSLYILKILISSFKIERGMTRMNEEEENGEWKYNACENRLNSE